MVLCEVRALFGGGVELADLRRNVVSKSSQRYCNGEFACWEEQHRWVVVNGGESFGGDGVTSDV